MAYNRELSQFASFVEVGVNNTIGITTSVGIGTTNPQHTLDVNGNINLPLGNFIRFGGQNRIRCGTGGLQNLDLISLYPATGISTVELNTSSSANILRIAAGGNVRGGLIEFRGGDVTIDPGILKFHTGTTGSQNVPPERMRIDAIGNVGIGTTNPQSKLHVVSTANAIQYPLRLENSGTSGITLGAAARFEVYNGSSIAYLGAILASASTWNYGTFSPNQISLVSNGSGGVRLAAASAPIVFHTGNSDPDLSLERVRITSTGSVGIGTTNPQYKLHVIGDAYVTGAFGIGSSLTVNGSIYPSIDATYDLGSPTNSWRNIYTNDLNLSNEKMDKGNDIDGTKGNWTIQEGEDHLYIINNKNGKKYKFFLEEIS